MVAAKLQRAWFAACCAIAPLPAQFINRATWLGVEQEDVRRSFEQGTEYYLDRFCYVVTPPWWDRGLPRFGDGVGYAFGSVSSSAFTVEGRLDAAGELGDGASFRYHLLQSENRDTRFLRNAIEFEYATGAETAVFVQAELEGDKSLIDVSIGAWLWRRDDTAMRVMLTAVDLPSRKGHLVEYERDAYAVMLSGAFGDREGHRVAFELGGQLPFELRDLQRGETFEMQRWIGSVECRLRAGECDWLVGALEREWTDKSLEPDAASSALAEDFARDFRQLRFEWWRDVPSTPWSVGVMHTRLDEDSVVRNDPADNLYARRDEWLGIARLRIPFSDKFSMEPQACAGNVRDVLRDGTDDRHVDRFEGKVAWNSRWDFSSRATLALVVTLELDELAFGGGGMQFVAQF